MEQLQQFEEWEEGEDLSDRWRDLEQDVESLIKAHRKLKLANKNLQSEWEAMVQRNMELRRRIEAIIGRVRALERSQDSQAGNTGQDSD